MIRKGIRSTLGVLLAGAGALGILGIILHILFQDLSLFGSPEISGPHIAILEIRIDSFTWWGKITNALIALGLVVAGRSLLRRDRKAEPNRVPTAD